MLFGQRPLLLNLLFCCFKVNQFQIDRPHSLRVEQLEEFIMMFCSNELIPKSFLSCFGTTFGSKSTKGPAPNLLLNTSDLVQAIVIKFTRNCRKASVVLEGFYCSFTWFELGLAWVENSLKVSLLCVGARREDCLNFKQFKAYHWSFKSSLDHVI